MRNRISFGTGEKGMTIQKTFFSKFDSTKQSLLVLGFAFVLAATFFLPYVIADGGPFYFYGDYTVQQIPFYVEAHKCVTSGDIFWNWNTDLGANFIGSYTYYMLGSPFFWLVLFLPSASMPYVLPWLLCLKIAVAALTSFTLFKMFTKKAEFAFIGSLLYAFSGFSIYNIFFNQFHEAIALFPLMLISMEELLRNNRRGFFAVSVMINAIANFYFFIAGCVFLVFYFFIRLYKDSFENIDISRFLGLITEAVLGTLGASVFLLPSYLAVIQNPRSATKIEGWSMLMYDEKHVYPNLVLSFFLPPELPARPNFYNILNAKWSSMAAWLPVFSMTGVIAWMRRKKDWISVLLYFLFICAFVPVLNSSFQLFSNAFYTRWFYLLTLIMALATVMALDKCRFSELKRGVVKTAVFTAAIALPVALVLNPENKDKKWYEQIGLFKYPERYITSIIIAGVSIWLAYLLYKLLKEKNKMFFISAVISLAVIISVYGNVFIAMGREHRCSPTDGRVFTEQNLKGREKILKFIPDIDNYRSDVMDGNLRIDNQTLFWQIPTVQAFHTMVPGSIMEFFPSVGVTRDVGSRPEPDHVWLRTLLSVKYMFDPQNSSDINITGWVKKGEVNNFTVWENTNYIPMGFTYDSYITRTQFDNTNEKEREKLLLHSILLSDEQIKKYGDYYSQVNDYETGYFSDYDMEEIVAERKQHTVYNFKRDKRGFSAEISLDEPGLVFFSVPYEGGWSASVNGIKANIEKVNVGFMAVFCKAGTSKIRFDYMTPGLIGGLFITVGAVIGIILYVILCRKFIKKKKSENFPEKEEQLSFFETQEL